MMAKSTAEKSRNFVRLVEERTSSKEVVREKKKKEQHIVVPYLTKDCISNILVRLPIESLPRSRSVCKLWYKIINSPFFIDAHLHRSETVLIFLTKGLEETLSSYSMFRTTPTQQEKPNTFSVEADLFQSQSGHVYHRSIFDPPRSKFYIQFMEIRDGNSKIGEFNATCLGHIKATCNGLILLDNEMKKGGLIAMNPVTRNVIMLPLGTLFPPHRESYGLAFCSSTRNYKLVHLFQDDMQYIGCEVFILGTRSWKAVDGPSFGLFSWFGYNPVSAIGALHWVPHIDHSDYIVSMVIDDEKFRKVLLPKSSRTYDGIIEMGGLLTFVSHEELNQVDIWILRSLNADWLKQHSITLNCITDMIPLCCTRLMGEMIFRDKDGSLYSYNFQLEVLKQVEMKKDVLIASCFRPHVNSLVSWQLNEHNQDVLMPARNGESDRGVLGVHLEDNSACSFRSLYSSVVIRIHDF